MNEEDNEAIYSNSCLKKGVGYSSGNYVKRNSNEKGEERLKQPTTNKLVFEESLRTKILYVRIYELLKISRRKIIYLLIN